MGTPSPAVCQGDNGAMTRGMPTEWQVPRDKATHGLQRNCLGGVEASVGCWSQLTKPSMLSLNASLCFLHVRPPSAPPSAQWDALCCHMDPFIPLSKAHKD